MKIHAFKPNNLYFGKETSNKTTYKPNTQKKYLEYGNNRVENRNYNKKSIENKNNLKVFATLLFAFSCLGLGIYSK